MIRPARPADAEALARLRIRAWQAAYREILPRDYLDDVPAERFTPFLPGGARAAGTTTLMAVGADADLGFVTFGEARDADTPGLGEVHALYVDPGRWRSGAGRELLSRAEAELLEEGFAEALLWTLEGFAPTERFYRAQGWRPDGRRREERPYGVTATVVRFRRRLGAPA